MVQDTLRNRLKSADRKNGVVNHEQERKHCPDFTTRDSTLTVLMQTSNHIRAIYHIFVVILLVLLFDTVIYDFVETGKINIGLSVIIYGFGDIKRGAKLWLYEFSIAILFYICLRTYGVASKLLRNNAAASRVLPMLGIAGLLILQVALVAVPILELKRKHLAIASSCTVTCEMFRFAMKIHAVAVACRQRCHKDGVPLPTFKQYLYFLFAPTLIYRDEYPRYIHIFYLCGFPAFPKDLMFLRDKNIPMKEFQRTTNIRWGVVIFHFTEVAAIIFYNSFLWERFLLPFWSDYGIKETVEVGTVVRSMFACVLPGVISFLCGFYCLLHAWLNAFAEMLKFGDRLFYEDWWTTSQFSKYYRAWNMVVHSWLRDHIYRPLAPHTGRVFSTLIVFLVSAIAHEVIIALSFGFFYPVLLMEFGVFGLIMLPLTYTSGRHYPNVFNLLMWLSFFLGNGILWSLYPMEFFARKNCPPSENDSFFIPKSWSCPEIILKPNWTFQNPLFLIN